MTATQEQQDTNSADNDSKPALSIKGFEVITSGCADKLTGRALAEQKLCKIEKRLADMKAERTLLNRHKHILKRWLR